MMDWLKRGGAPTDDLGRDMLIAEALQALDPASEDPNYWLRFRSWVMAEAAPGLARRRLMAELTVVDVMASWSRAVVPTALAAGLAALAMMPSDAPPPVEAAARSPEVGVEELLVEDVPVETQQVLLSPTAAAGLVAFAADVY